jgi:ABC-2 type transport system permease protein
MEILMTSVQPTQMLNGKIVALGLVGLLQTVIWSGAAYALLMISGQKFSLPISFQLPPQILLWGVLFFLLGYAVYGSLMAAIGALVPNLREASQATTVIMLPMIVPLVFITALIQKPNSALSIGLSLFPLTSPVTMMTRLTAGSVPLWQLLLAVLLLVLTAWFLLHAIAGMFRAQTLLSGQEFNLKLLFKALIGKA